MVPGWLQAVAWIWLVLSVGSALVILADVARGYRQPMGVMEAVWPITALYFGPLALVGYWRIARPYTERWRTEHGADWPDTPHWARVAVSTSHCGAGCTLGDILAENIVFWLGLALFGEAVFASFALDYTFAFAFGVVFQALAIAAMGAVTLRVLATRTVKADLLSLTAFEVGLFAWMGLTWFVFFTDPHLVPSDATFWFMMQVGMIIGFFTSYPANVWLIRRGVKEAM